MPGQWTISEHFDHHSLLPHMNLNTSGYSSTSCLNYQIKIDTRRRRRWTWGENEFPLVNTIVVALLSPSIDLLSTSKLTLTHQHPQQTYNQIQSKFPIYSQIPLTQYPLITYHQLPNFLIQNPTIHHYMPIVVTS